MLFFENISFYDYLHIKYLLLIGNEQLNHIYGKGNFKNQDCFSLTTDTGRDSAHCSTNRSFICEEGRRSVCRVCVCVRACVCVWCVHTVSGLRQ